MTTPVGSEVANPSCGTGVDCVFLSCFDHNVRFLASMLGQGGVRLHLACLLEMADFLLVATGASVLLLDTTFLDGSWEEALEMVALAHPLVTVLICADPVDRHFVSSARDRGALDVLFKPLDLGRLRSCLWKAHEITLERRLWRAERELERYSNQPVDPGFCLAKIK